jgi:hypothetical protein
MKYLVDGAELFHCGHTPTHLLFTKDEGGHNKLVEVPYDFSGIISVWEPPTTSVPSVESSKD